MYINITLFIKNIFFVIWDDINYINDNINIIVNFFINCIDK